jgi:phosphatidylglycerol---prolipoprotein diacylglyceryl transferase
VITLPFDPNIHLGPLALSWHGLFTAVGIFFGVALPVRLLRGHVAEDAVYSIATWGVVGGIVGARLLHVIDRWSYYAEHLEQIPLLWTGGIAVWGAVIGGVLTGTVVAIRRRAPIGLAADAAAPGLGLGLAIGRIGDIINGEHHATACDVGVCVGYTHPDTLGQAGPVHLAVGYEMLWVLLTVAFALVLFRRRELVRGKAGRPNPPPGVIFWMWLLLYGLARFTISFLRIEDPTSFLGLRQDQLIGLAAMAVALGALVVLLARRRGPYEQASISERPDSLVPDEGRALPGRPAR